MSGKLDLIFKEHIALETPRLILDNIIPEDRQGVFSVYGDKEVARYNPWAAFDKIELADDKIQAYQKAFEGKQKVRWAIRDKNSRLFLGDCGLVSYDWRGNRAEIGFNLGREHWGKGIMREAVGAVLRQCFEGFQINRVEALVLPENKGSWHLLEKAGFLQEGLLREAAYIKGLYRDLKLYALLAKDFKHGF